MLYSRMKAELEELIKKIDKLRDFICSYFQQLDKKEQDLLREQLHHMERYASVLTLRIEYSTNKMFPALSERR
jgi:flagellar biosynthesis chaperone FliJ